MGGTPPTSEMWAAHSDPLQRAKDGQGKETPHSGETWQILTRQVTKVSVDNGRAPRCAVTRRRFTSVVFLPRICDPRLTARTTPDKPPGMDFLRNAWPLVLETAVGSKESLRTRSVREVPKETHGLNGMRGPGWDSKGALGDLERARASGDNNTSGLATNAPR